MEVAVATAILLIAVTTSVRSQVSSKRLMDHSRETELAVALMKETMVLLQGETIEELADDTGTYVPGQAIQTEELLHGQSVVYSTPGYTPGEELPNVLTLRVDLTWAPAQGPEQTVSLVEVHR